MAVGGIGDQVAIDIYQGAPFGPLLVNYEDTDGAPISLTDCTFAGWLRKTWNTSVVAEFVVTATGEPGQISVEMLQAATAALSVGGTLADPASQYVYAIEMTDADGLVWPLINGTASVYRTLRP